MRVNDLKTLPGLWAKLSKTGDKPDWHPLTSHAADAAAVAEFLLSNLVLRKRLAHLSGQPELDDVIAAKLCALIALHDLGKTSLGFQQQVLSKPYCTTRGHCNVVIAAYSSDLSIGQQFWDALSTDSLINAIAGGNELLYFEYITALMAHHGSPLSIDSLESAARGCRSCWEPHGSDAPLKSLSELVSTVKSWYPAFDQPGSLPSNPEFIHAFAGLVTLADWLASDENLFPLDNGKSKNPIEDARARARRALPGLGLSGAPLRKALEKMSLEFQDLFAVERPYPVQRAITQYDRPAPGTVVILEAETGSGKTETALRHFLGLHRENLVDGLYFALPLRTAAVQIADRLRLDLARIAPDVAKILPVITAVPGYTSALPSSSSEATAESYATDGYTLPDDTDEQGDSDTSPAMIRRDWAADHPKRFLAATIAVGTIDQALMSVLRVRHAHLRASSHLRQLLVVDEVHASDPYMRTLLSYLVERHRKSGGHVLLMSATLGSHARTKFLKSPPQTFEEACEYPYPSITATDRELTHIDTSSEQHRRVKNTAVETQTFGDSPTAVAQYAADAAGRGARVLVIRNRVVDAVATQQALEAINAPTLCVGDSPTLHHSRFAKEDRQQLDRAITAALGKGSTKPVVVVATQTAEQSLDIDADLLITDLAPADIILQRIGRLHRHNRAHRPEGFEHPKLLLLTPHPDYFETKITHPRTKAKQGWGSVYPNIVSLQATLDAVRETNTIVVPTMNRSLVEKATHPQQLQALATKHGSAWETHLQSFYGKELAEKKFADTSALDWTTLFSNLTFPSKLEPKFSTRLGDQDRAAVFTRPQVGPFGSTVSQLTISAWMCLGVPSEAEASEIEHKGRQFTFLFGNKRFLYDRHGLSMATQDDVKDQEVESIE